MKLYELNSNDSIKTEDDKSSDTNKFSHESEKLINYNNYYETKSSDYIDYLDLSTEEQKNAKKK